MMGQHILQARLCRDLLHLALDIVQQNAQFLDELLGEPLRLEHRHARLRLCRLAREHLIGREGKALVLHRPPLAEICKKPPQAAAVMWEQNKYFEVLALLIVQPAELLHAADHVIGFGARLLRAGILRRKVLILVRNAGFRPALDQFLEFIAQDLLLDAELGKAVLLVEAESRLRIDPPAFPRQQPEKTLRKYIKQLHFLTSRSIHLRASSSFIRAICAMISSEKASRDSLLLRSP